MIDGRYQLSFIVHVHIGIKNVLRILLLKVSLVPAPDQHSVVVPHCYTCRRLNQFDRDFWWLRHIVQLNIICVILIENCVCIRIWPSELLQLLLLERNCTVFSLRRFWLILGLQEIVCFYFQVLVLMTQLFGMFGFQVINIWWQLSIIR